MDYSGAGRKLNCCYCHFIVIFVIVVVVRIVVINIVIVLIIIFIFIVIIIIVMRGGRNASGVDPHGGVMDGLGGAKNDSRHYLDALYDDRVEVG